MISSGNGGASAGNGAGAGTSIHEPQIWRLLGPVQDRLDR
jgi:hypothetical protein